MHRLRPGIRALKYALYTRRSSPWSYTSSQPWQKSLPSRPFTDSRPGTEAPVEPAKPAKPAITLRPYQQECIQAVLDHVERGERRLGISLATGGGKTVIFSHLIGELPLPNPDATQTLVLAHTRELVEQAARHCRTLYPLQSVEIEMADEHASGTADITVASMKSITSGERLTKFDPARFKLLLVDEAHHIAAATYMRVLKHFKLEEKHATSHVTLVGVSATLSRADGLSLGTAMDHIVYHLDLKDMIKSGYLSDALFTAIKSKADLSVVKTSASNGDFQTNSLGQAVNTAANNELTVRCWLEHASERKATLVFCVNIAHAKSLTEAFRQQGIDARFITGTTSVKARAEALAALKRGEYKVLLNVGVLIEGFDLPNIDCILLARPTRSSNLLVQMIGRGLRTHPGKKDCLIIDFVASHKSGVISTPTLFGLDPQELDRIDAATLALMGEAAIEERGQAESALRDDQQTDQLHGDITVESWDSLIDLIDETAQERLIGECSPNVWVQVTPVYYVLSSSWVKNFVSVRQEGNNWAAKMTPSLRFLRSKSKSPFGKPLHIASAASLKDAIKAADEYAKQKYDKGISKSEPWRSRPATDKQLGFLQKLLGTTDDLSERGLTGGQVRNLIVKLLRGSKGVYKRIQAEKAKARRAREKKKKEDEAKRIRKVMVGPVE